MDIDTVSVRIGFVQGVLQTFKRTADRNINICIVTVYTLAIATFTVLGAAISDTRQPSERGLGVIY